MNLEEFYKKGLIIGQNITLDPFSAVNLVCKKLEEIKQKTFAEQVAKGLKYVDMSDVNKDDFLNRFYLIFEAVKKAQTNEKIELLTLLFNKSIILYSEISNDDYELFVRIVDSLTYNEFIILKILSKEENNLITLGTKYMETATEEAYKEIKKTLMMKATEEAYTEIKNTLMINQSELVGYTDRLKGQGLLEMLAGLASDDLRLDCGNTSQLFKNLIEFLDKSESTCHCEE